MPAAGATVYSGSATDPAGDGPSANRDLLRAAARYDNNQGHLSFSVRLAAAPSGDLQITTAVGRRTSTGSCGTPALLLGAFFPSGSTIWGVEKDGETPLEESGTASRTVTGQTVSLQASDPELRSFRPNCASTILSDPSDPATVYDQITSFAVKPPPPKPRLRMKFSRLGNLKRGVAKPVTLRVTNVGKAAARRVVARVGIKGQAVLKPRLRKLGSIAPGKSKTARFRVKVKPNGKGLVRIQGSAQGRKVRAVAKTSFRIRVPLPPPPPSTGGLSGKIFWGFESYQWDRSADLVFLHFTSRNLVRWGTPDKGLKRCRRPDARVKKGEMQPGCLRYSYDRRTGRLQIGKVRGTYRRGNLKLKMDSDVWGTSGETWYLGLTAKPGTKFRTKLINRGYYGACGITPYCTTWAEYLQLTRDGRFGRQSSSLTTGGIPGLSFIAISKLGPNERGRYRVLPGSRIRFSYASGKKVVETLIVQTNKRGRPDPVREGLLLNGTWFYLEDD